MILRDISFELPEENILFDEVLLQLAEEGRNSDVLRFWESKRCFIVLGRIGRVEEEINREQVKAGHIPVLRRSSGGGTVLQGPGCLNYSLILSKRDNQDVVDLKRSYQYILGKVVNAFKSEGFMAVYLPISDIASEQSLRKFSGNAQKRGRDFILHHGTVLYDFNLDLIERYLSMPKDMPEYRKNRGHLDFVQNIPLGPDRIKEALVREFKANHSQDNVDGQEDERMKQLLLINKTVLGI
ncbi:MAG: biotin/lipoate A/B protein ligase family protein [Candidatus Omnitrophota bacterium]